MKQREADGIPIQVAVIGAGEMGAGLINQIERHCPGMRVAVVFNRSIEKAVQACRDAGLENPRSVRSAMELDDAVTAGHAAVTDDPGVATGAERVDVVVEMTGTLSFAFTVILEALRAGKHVVSFNAELDATVGPLLQRKAREGGVRYTLGDGDQPGVTLNLCRQVRAMGFEPLVLGNNKGLLDHYRTPETQKAFAEANGISAVMATSFADGTKVSLEQASIANATGFRVARRGMLAIEYDGHVDELNGRYDFDDLKANGGIVEMVVGAKPGPGVFVYAATDDPVSRRFLAYGKLGDGPLYSFYVPYHLLFFELPFSIVRLVDFSDGTVDADDRFHVEVVSAAKRDLKAGETLDGIGGFMVYGQCENRPEVVDGGLLPVGLSEGLVLKRPIAKDEVIPWDAVICDPADPLIAAYRSIS